MPSNALALLPATGTVRWFDSVRGHGFVTCDAGSPECFLHQSSLCIEDLRLIEEGTRLAFDVVQLQPSMIFSLAGSAHLSVGCCCDRSVH